MDWRENLIANHKAEIVRLRDGRARYAPGIREIFWIGDEPFDGKPATFSDREIRFLDMVTEDAT